MRGERPELSPRGAGRGRSMKDFGDVMVFGLLTYVLLMALFVW